MRCPVRNDNEAAMRGKGNTMKITKLVGQYLETAIWASTDEDGEPLDSRFVVDSFADEAVKQAEKDCLDFMAANDVGDLDDDDVGHNFWLTRNGHGTGFWDRGLGALGDRLTKASEAYGSCDVYVGDDGKLHLS